MKNIILLLFLLAFSTAGFSQGMSVTDDYLDKVVLAVKLDGLAMANLEMRQELSLTEDQLSQVEWLNEQRVKKLAEAEQTYADNAMLLASSIREINIACDQNLKLVLNESQMQHFLELEGRFHMQHLSENETE